MKARLNFWKIGEKKLSYIENTTNKETHDIFSPMAQKIMKIAKLVFTPDYLNIFKSPAKLFFSMLTGYVTGRVIVSTHSESC